MRKQLFAFVLGITFFIPNNAFSMDPEELQENNPPSLTQQKTPFPFSFTDELDLENNRFFNGISNVYNRLDCDPRNWSSKTKILVGGIGLCVFAYITINVLMTEARGALYGAGASRFVPAT